MEYIIYTIENSIGGTKKCCNNEELRDYIYNFILTTDFQYQLNDDYKTWKDEIFLNEPITTKAEEEHEQRKHHGFYDICKKDCIIQNNEIVDFDIDNMEIESLIHLCKQISSWVDDDGALRIIEIVQGPKLITYT